MKERLQKLIAQAGLASRREAEQWIAAGRVTVNGQVAGLGDRADLTRDKVAIDGKALQGAEKPVYILLNKPLGYVTTLRDPQGRKVVTELVKGVGVRVFPVGRLDVNSEGVLLLTNDGGLAHRLAHPSHRISKTYLVKVRGLLTPQALTRLEGGVELEDGRTAPARIDKVRETDKNTWFEITITEGRNRQVRRMCEAVGHPVVRLKRIRVAFLQLGALKPGSFRHLSAAEVSKLKNLN